MQDLVEFAMICFNSCSVIRPRTRLFPPKIPRVYPVQDSIRIQIFQHQNVAIHCNINSTLSRKIF